MLNSNEKQSTTMLNPALKNFAGLKDNEDNLKTQVGILESPSLLKPIFDFVVEKKELKTKKSNVNYDFWKKNSLTIDLKKNTSILNIFYKDTDKQLIIPVLKKMSMAYQDYSGQSKKRREELTNNYLNEQVKIYKLKISN